MYRRPHSHPKGSAYPEYITLVALVVIASATLLTFTNLEPADPNAHARAPLDQLVTLNCATATNANDVVTSQQARAHNCFHLLAGQDRLSIVEGDAVIFPGAGDDRIFVQNAARRVEIVYEGGDDTYHIEAGATVLDLSAAITGQVKLGANPDPGKAAKDLIVRSAMGTITIVDHFSNRTLVGMRLGEDYLTADDIDAKVITDQTSAKSDMIFGTPRADIIMPGSGDDYVQAGLGDDLIIYHSGHDRYDPGPGNDTLQIDILPSQATFSISPNFEDVILQMASNKTIILLGQATSAPTSHGAKFTTLRMRGLDLDERAILARALSDQSTQGDDLIRGTVFSEQIYPGKGRNEIWPGGGGDIIHHQGGQDTIGAAAQDGYGGAVLDLTDFTRGDISATRTATDDLLMTFPDGSSVTILHFYGTGPEASAGPVELFRLQDELLPQGLFRQFFPLPISSGQ